MWPRIRPSRLIRRKIRHKTWVSPTIRRKTQLRWTRLAILVRQWILPSLAMSRPTRQLIRQITSRTRAHPPTSQQTLLIARSPVTPRLTRQMQTTRLQIRQCPPIRRQIWRHRPTRLRIRLRLLIKPRIRQIKRKPTKRLPIRRSSSRIRLIVLSQLTRQVTQPKIRASLSIRPKMPLHPKTPLRMSRVIKRHQRLTKHRMRPRPRRIRQQIRIRQSQLKIIKLRL